MNAQPQPLPLHRPPQRSPLDVIEAAARGIREDLAPVEALLARGSERPDGERRAQ